MFQPDILVRGFRKIASCLQLFQYLRYQKKKLHEIRQKEKIKVLFVLSDVSLWKTESLYLEMLRNERFDPILGVVLLVGDTPSESVRKYNELLSYLNRKEYDSVQMIQPTLEYMEPDIVFYQQPYPEFVSSGVFFESTLSSLFCYAPYGLFSLAPVRSNDFSINTLYHKYCFQIYFENELSFELNKIASLKGKNSVITGTPMQDILSQPASNFTNPWKNKDDGRKRIIWAPHHTIPAHNNFLNFSCFLDVCDEMIEMAQKYRDKIQFAFKPHPFLRKKLIACWGEAKTEAYYQKWASMENTQLEVGEYMGLFKYSDAMIHDCCSFTLEYCYTQNPVMYLIKEEGYKDHYQTLNSFGQRAFDLHTKGFTKEDIEGFIQNVLAGEDSLKQNRKDFYDKYLLPPHGKSACENIINAILGEKEYK